MDLPCTGSSRTHRWLFAPALLVCVSAYLSSGGRATCVYQGRERTATGSPGREYATEELLPNSTKPPPPLPLSPIFPRVFLSRVGTILRGGREGRYDEIREHSRKIKWKLRGGAVRDGRMRGGARENESNFSTLQMREDRLKKKNDGKIAF